MMLDVTVGLRTAGALVALALGERRMTMEEISTRYLVEVRRPLAGERYFEAGGVIKIAERDFGALRVAVIVDVVEDGK